MMWDAKYRACGSTRESCPVERCALLVGRRVSVCILSEWRVANWHVLALPRPWSQQWGVSLAENKARLCMSKRNGLVAVHATLERSDWSEVLHALGRLGVRRARTLPLARSQTSEELHWHPTCSSQSSLSFLFLLGHRIIPLTPLLYFRHLTNHHGRRCS